MNFWEFMFKMSTENPGIVVLFIFFGLPTVAWMVVGAFAAIRGKKMDD